MAVDPGWPASSSPQAGLRPVEDSDEDTARRCGQLRGRSRSVVRNAGQMHNGVFTTLEEVVDFYNTRDVKDDWPDPEVAENVHYDEFGDLRLTDREAEDIVAFRHTLTDGFVLPDPGE